MSIKTHPYRTSVLTNYGFSPTASNETIQERVVHLSQRIEQLKVLENDLIQTIENCCKEIGRLKMEIGYSGLEVNSCRRCFMRASFHFNAWIQGTTLTQVRDLNKVLLAHSEKKLATASNKLNDVSQDRLNKECEKGEIEVVS